MKPILIGSGVKRFLVIAFLWTVSAYMVVASLWVGWKIIARVLEAT